MEFTGRATHTVQANRQDFVLPNSVYETATGSGIFVENTSIPITGGDMTYWQNVYNNIKENYVKDATAFKIREVAFSYDLPSKLLENTFVRSLRVGFVGRNLFTWLPSESKFSDPEFQNLVSTTPTVTGSRNAVPANAIGIGGYLQGPPTKSIGFSLNLEF